MSGADETGTLSINVVFMGGLELLFNKQQAHKVAIPARVLPAARPSSSTNTSSTSKAQIPSTENDNGGAADVDGDVETETKPADVNFLISYLRDTLLTDPRAGLFVEEGGGSGSGAGDGPQLRPGILVLINDSDWELEGEGAYTLKNGDEVVFISTLHGG